MNLDFGYLAAFVGASVLLVGLPGPNIVYICTRAMTQGRRAGVVSALGVETGTFIHATAAALGLAAVVATSPVVFKAITYAGVAYLVYLGLRTLRSVASHGLTNGRPAPAPLGKVYRDGLLVNLFNPKVQLFFLAFLPQFTTPGASPAELRGQLLALGAATFVIALLIDIGYATGASALGTRLNRSAAGDGRWQRRSVAGIYFGLAALAAVTAGGHA